jgi:hypothetical protein
MAYQPNDPYRPSLPEEDRRRQADLDNELKADPEIAEGTASGAKVAMFALAIAVVLGAVFYGLNNTSVSPTGTSTAQNTQQTSPPATPPGMRDVTPRANTEPGVTTGAAPARPQVPPPAGTQIDRSANPPASAPAAK